MINFRMTQIKVEQFAILSDMVPNDFDIETKFSIGCETSDKILSTRLRINYVSDESIMLTMTISCSFSIDAESWLPLIKEGKVVVPRGFLVHMAVHTLGTARGVLFCKSEDTEWQSRILPPVNVDEIFKEDLVIGL